MMMLQQPPGLLNPAVNSWCCNGLLPAAPKTFWSDVIPTVGSQLIMQWCLLEHKTQVCSVMIHQNWLACLGVRLQDWDATTTDWFTNKEEDDIPLPEYKLVFLWFDKNIAVAVDQV